MPDTNRPWPDNWDSFSRQVQERLIEGLDLENAEISVLRHECKNKTVKLEVKFTPQASNPNETGRNSPFAHGAIPRDERSHKILNDKIHAILDDLLEHCTVDFGGITFFVNRGWLKGTDFTYSNRPDEPTDRHFNQI